MNESIVFSDFYRMPQKEQLLFKELEVETDEDKRDSIVNQIHSLRGIYRNEDGNLGVNEMNFVLYIMEAFSMICVKGNIAFYNYARHKYEYIDEIDYLPFFKALLDEVDRRLWNPKLDG